MSLQEVRSRFFGVGLAALAICILPDEGFAAEVTIGRAVVALNAPWRFHTGDDLRWSDPGFDDSAWEVMDLTPSPGAHDSDVGLSGYVPGWCARGYRGYSGYAWYRMKVLVTAPTGDALALAGPPMVDDTYQMFVDGALVASSGDFSRGRPVVYSVQPRMMMLRPSSQSSNLLVIALRVWMSAASLADPEAGGVHIAPMLGEAPEIEARYQLQWLETIRGYVVDVIEPILFLLLAIMAWSLMRLDRSDAVYAWLIAALALTAALRVNQATFFWGQFESIQAFDLVRNVLLVPSVLGAWTIVWAVWFERHGSRRLLYGIVFLVALYIVSQETVRLVSWMRPLRLSTWIRITFLLLQGFIVYRGFRKARREALVAFPAILLMSVGLFAEELSRLHVRSIWFPFGTGVSRTQFAYAAFDVALFALLLRRLGRIAVVRAPYTLA